MVSCRGGCAMRMLRIDVVAWLDMFGSKNKRNKAICLKLTSPPLYTLDAYGCIWAQTYAPTCDPSSPNVRFVVARSVTHDRHFYTYCHPVRPVVAFPRPVIARGAGRLVPTGRPRSGRWNEEVAWGFGAR